MLPLICVYVYTVRQLHTQRKISIWSAAVIWQQKQNRKEVQPFCVLAFSVNRKPECDVHRKHTMCSSYYLKTATTAEKHASCPVIAACHWNCAKGLRATPAQPFVALNLFNFYIQVSPAKKTLLALHYSREALRVKQRKRQKQWYCYKYQLAFLKSCCSVHLHRLYVEASQLINITKK